MKAEKLPSGSWRCRVYDYTDQSGKKHYKTFTVQDPSKHGKKICEAEATAWALNKKKKTSKIELTFGEALERYISGRESILSPSSIRKYRSMQRNHFADLSNMRLRDIDEDVVQEFINTMRKNGASPQLINNVHGLISPVLRQNRINLLPPAKPKKKRKEKYIPTDEEIFAVLDVVKGTEMELPTMLAMFAAMRRGEVSALDASDLQGNRLHIHRNMVDTPDHTWIVKDPKTEAGDRYVVLPQFVCDLFPTEGPVTALKPNQITSSFEHIVKNAGINHITFHTLRHWNTSVKHDIGIPDVAILAENGWSPGDERVMKEVYRHVRSDKDYGKESADYFDKMISERKHMAQDMS